MTVSGVPSPQSGVAGGMSPMGHQPANLGDILERVLDRGLVIVGDIRVSLLDIELLTIKLRLLIASVDTARQLGIDWWENDPWLSSRAQATSVTTAAQRREEIERREARELVELRQKEREVRPRAVGEDEHA